MCQVLNFAWFSLQLNPLLRLTFHCGMIGREYPKLVIYHFHKKNERHFEKPGGERQEQTLVEGHRQGWSFIANLICPLLCLSQDGSSRKTQGPHFQISWVMHSPLVEAQGSRWEQLLLFIIIGFNCSRQNPNESFTR